MNGIPVQVWKGDGPKTVFLGFRQAGTEADRMRQLRRRFAACTRAAASAWRDMVRCGALAGNVTDESRLIALGEQQDTAAREAQQASDEALDAARELALESLRLNYGDSAEDELDGFTDAQLRSVPAILESGAAPADFFQARGTPPNGSSTGPGDGTGSESCSEPGSPAGKSRRAT